MAESRAVVFKGRRFRPSELELISEVVSSCSGLSCQELAKTVCELVKWRRPNGGLKTWECRELLVELERAGGLALPAPRQGRPRGSRTSVPRTGQAEPQAPIRGNVRDVAPVTLRLVAKHDDHRVWRELVERYHYLGHAVPFGAHLRYLIEVSQPARTIVGCLQLTSPAWRVAVRDRWVGWTEAVRRRQLQRVVQNSRFLLLPWVEVRNLASTVLARMARQLPTDWERAYGVGPMLLETFVDSARFRGTCYRAANWIELGTTQGRGRQDQAHKRQGRCPKTVFVYPLVPRARARLCGKD